MRPGPIRSTLLKFPRVAFRIAMDAAARVLGTARKAARSPDASAESVPAAPLSLAAPVPPAAPLYQSGNRARARDAQLRRSSDFLEFAQAAGGFGVYDLNILTGSIGGTALFFEPIGLGRRILIVEDIPASRHSLAAKLELASFDTLSVGGVDEALEQLAKEPRVDLVLADELMPRKGGLDLLNTLRADPRYATLPFILLSLFGAEQNAADWLHRPDAVGLKPIRAAALCALVLQVLTGTQPHKALRVLQKLAADVTIANNGAEALERIAESTFDAVLMDCQMPVMDGFTAARRIRESERQKGRGKRLPIIALTANVMSEDRENCIAAGMDAHLGKPIEPAQLIDCLGRYLKPHLVRPEVDLGALRDLTGGDIEFERELVDTFISSGDQCLAEILSALQVSDFDTIGKRAHSLKGASANIHAPGLAAAAAAAASSLETAARANAVREIDGLVQLLTVKLQAVNAELLKVG
jgi:CheY-like chemotaxis protein